MDASTTTTIRGVSIFSRQRTRKADIFDMALSPDGITIQRPSRSDQFMGWDRISQWEIEERPGCVVLTLRGGGSVTPLMVKGWTLEDLERVMRETTEGTTGPVETLDMTPAPVAAPAVPDASDTSDATAASMESPQPRAARRQAARRPRRQRERSLWKAVVAVVLLGVLATAVVLVLLQSAGVISWSFLGPTA
jgi:hypothetical protein